ncbi:MAG: alpha/beta fold hydrolase [Chloroflexi bacterium]|nr:alpha/beta fold hydrolase [Chloroflexota bacterium]
MATFVLVHGGWGGGWEWRPVADRLVTAGHVTYRPTLTGLGERRHLGHPKVDLETHIKDVIGVLEAEDLVDVVLVGQSYAGAVVTGVADRVPERIRRLVYVDAFVPRDGESVNDLSPVRFVERLRALARTDGDGWQVPLPFDDLGLPADIAGWYGGHLGPHPLATLDQPVRLTDAVESVPRSYVDCAPPGAKATWLFRSFADRARSESWDQHDLPVGHDAHVIAPDRLAALLIGISALQPEVAVPT